MAEEPDGYRPGQSQSQGQTEAISDVRPLRSQGMARAEGDADPARLRYPGLRGQIPDLQLTQEGDQKPGEQVEVRPEDEYGNDRYHGTVKTNGALSARGPERLGGERDVGQPGAQPRAGGAGIEAAARGGRARLPASAAANAPRPDHLWLRRRYLRLSTDRPQRAPRRGVLLPVRASAAGGRCDAPLPQPPSRGDCRVPGH